MAGNDDDTPSRRKVMKVAALAATAAGTAARPARAAGGDAELLALCAEREGNTAAVEALMEPYYDAVEGWPPTSRPNSRR